MNYASYYDLIKQTFPYGTFKYTLRDGVLFLHGYDLWHSFIVEGGRRGGGGCKMKCHIGIKLLILVWRGCRMKELFQISIKLLIIVFNGLM